MASRRIEAAANEKIEAAKAQAQSDVAAARMRQDEIALELRNKAKELADAQREAAEAQLVLQQHVEQVAKRQEWRKLTPEQKVEFVKFLKSAPKLPVEIRCVDQESCAFSKQIGEALREAGWEVLGEDAYSILTPFAGILLTQKTQGDAFPATEGLYSALSTAGFTPKPLYDSDGSLREGFLRLSFGAKS